MAVMVIFCTDNGLPAGFLAVNDVIPGLGSHQDPDAALGGRKGFCGGSPNQVTVAFHAKDVEGRKHGMSKRLIP
jgi:hypothetical protein